MLAVLLGLGAALAWGLHDVLARFTAQGPNVMGQILVVTATGGPILLMTSGDDLAALAWQEVILAALAGFSYMLAYVGLYRAFALAPARVVSPVLGAYPLLSLLVAALAGAAVTPSDWLAAALVVAGIAAVAALAAPEDQRRGALKPALLWAVLGAGGFAATFALGQAASQSGHSLAAGAVTRLSGLVCILTILAFQRPSLAPIARNWRLLVVMGLLDTVALALVMRAGGMPDAEYASVAASLFGVGTILLSWAILGERVRPAQWIGIAMVFGGIGVLAV